MDRNLALELLFVTESAAIAAARLRGRGDKKAADRAATMAMRKALAPVAICGTMRAGEGELDECTDEEMIRNGERVGRWLSGDPVVDVATDPLECTDMCASNGPGSIATMAFSEDGMLLNVPDIYMDKIAVGPEARGAIDIRRGVTWNLSAVAEAKGVSMSDLVAIILDRPRHQAIIEEVRAAGACAQLIPAGDLMAAIATADPATAVDILFGSGGAPEGILAAAALRSMGGDMQGMLMPKNDDQARRAAEMTKRPIDHAYLIEELAGGNVMFAATGVTDGPVFKGVRFLKDGAAMTESLVTRSLTGSISWIRKRRRADQVATV